MTQNKKRATLRTVAKEANVGVSTASCILRGVDTGWTMNPATKQRVIDAAKELNYRPNALARSLVIQKSEHIGFLIPSSVPDKWKNHYFSGLLCGAERITQEKGFSLLIGRYNEKNIDDFILPKQVRERTVDGVILTGYAPASVINQFHDYGIICIAAGNSIEIENQIETLPNRLTNSLVEALSYLTGLGHRKIGWHRQTETRVQKEANAAIRAKLNQFPGGMDCEIIQFPHEQSDTEEANALATLHQWLSFPETQRPTALIMNTPAALMFLIHLRKYNFSCPQDISIVAIGNAALNQMCYPALTAIDFDLESKGAMAAELLIHQLCEKEKPFTPVSTINEKFVVRDSCLPPC